MSTAARVTPVDFAPPSAIGRMKSRSMMMGGVFALAAIVGAWYNLELFMRSWLVGFMFWLGITLGSLVLLMLQYTTGGHWGVLGRRYWEAATSAIPVMFLFWILLWLGSGHIYEWTKMSPEKLGLSRAHWWLNPTAFFYKGVAYFVIWWFWAWRLKRWSRTEEAGLATPQKFVGIQNFSGAGIVVYALTITFASVDWVMSLNPEWFSTVFGMLFMVGECLTTFAFTIWVLAKLSPLEPLSRIFKAEYFHDFGKLMFAFVILWAYLSFAQWLIIWSGNLTEEIRWYLDRVHGQWKVVATALIFLHFVLPFALLLSRNLKRQPRRLVKLAIWIMAVRLLDLFWLVQPTFKPSPGELAPLGWEVVVLTVVNVLAMGGIWLTWFFWQLEKRAIIPVNDPEFAEMLEVKHHG